MERTNKQKERRGTRSKVRLKELAKGSEDEDGTK